MATNAERQRAFRRRHLEDDAGRCRRLNTVVNARAKESLVRLARFQNMTQRELLEKMLAEAEREALKGMTPDQVVRHYGGFTKEWFDWSCGLGR